MKGAQKNSCRKKGGEAAWKGAGKGDGSDLSDHVNVREWLAADSGRQLENLVDKEVALFNFGPEEVAHLNGTTV